MAEDQVKKEELDELEGDQERIVTLKINLEGPAEFVSWLKENRPTGQGMGNRVWGLFPSEFRTHMRAAQREQLLALRSLLDAAVARTEAKPRRSHQPVDVEIE